MPMKTLFIATVGEFYKQRAGFFLTVVLLAFGFMGAGEHRALASFLASGAVGLAVLLVLWLAYTLMCGVFWNSLWRARAYTFVYHARLAPALKKLTWLGGIAAGFLIPVLLYGVWVIKTASGDSNLTGVFSVAGFWLLLWCSLVVLGNYLLNNQDTASKKTSLPAFASFKRPPNRVFWAVEWLVREKALTLLICKTGAAVFTAATLLYYGTDDYDVRLPAIGLLFAVLMNIGISHEIFHWETEIWRWGRSLPIPVSKRVAEVVVLHLLVLLPDTAVMLRYGFALLSIPEILQLLLLQGSFLLWYHGTLYRTEKSLEDSLTVVFRVFIPLTLLILYRVPLPLISAGFLGVFYWQYRRAGV